MGCNPSKCPPYNMGTASSYEWMTHTSWAIDYADTGMPRYGTYFHVPCLHLMWTWFGAEKYGQEKPFQGIIEYNAYNIREAYLVHRSETVWRKVYNPGECGSEPFDDLYLEHANRMMELYPNSQFSGD